MRIPQIFRSCSSLLAFALTLACARAAAAQLPPRSVRSQFGDPTDDRPRAVRSEPELLPDPGGPVYEGMQRVWIPSRPLIAAGSLMWFGGYLVASIGGLTDCHSNPHCGLDLIPVFGPFASLAARTGTVPVETTVLSLTLGSFQLVGSLMITFAASFPRSYLKPLGNVTIGPVANGQGIVVGGRF